MDWFDAEKCPPEQNGDYLCWYEYYRYGEYNCMYQTCDRGHYFNGQWYGEPMRGHRAKVLGWFPLPEPPKEATGKHLIPPLTLDLESIDPVAKWVQRKSVLYCSNCNKGYRNQKGQNPFLWKHCPNRGARIEGAYDEKSDCKN